jgi:hypothetical protein
MGLLVPPDAAELCLDRRGEKTFSEGEARDVSRNHPHTLAPHLPFRTAVCDGDQVWVTGMGDRFMNP